MKTQAILVANDPVYAHWLNESLGGGVEVSLSRHGAGLPDITHVGLAFVEIDPENPTSGAHVVDQLLERHPELPVFAVGPDSSSDAVLAAVRAGARDYFVLDRDRENLAGLVGKVLRRSVGGARGAQQARLYTAVSAQSADGLSFFAGHLALALADRAGPGDRTLLIDAGLPTGASLVFFNVNQTYTLADALHDVYRCDQTLIDTAFARHDSGVFVLSLAEDLLAYPDLDGNELVALVETLRAHFATIVVAADANAPASALCSLINQSTRCLLVTDQSILRSRKNKQLLSVLRQEECGMDRTGLVIDNYRSRLGLGADNLAELLDLPVLATLSGSGVARVQAMNAGESLFASAPRDGYATDMRTLAEQLDRSGESADMAQVGTGGWLRRLFSS